MGQTWSHGFSAALMLRQLLRALSRSSAYIANAAVPSSASAPAFHTLTDQPDLPDSCRRLLFHESRVPHSASFASCHTCRPRLID